MVITAGQDKLANGILGNAHAPHARRQRFGATQSTHFVQLVQQNTSLASILHSVCKAGLQANQLLAPL